MIRSLLTGLLMLALPAMASAAPAKDALTRIKATKSVSIAYRADALPFSFLDDSKQPNGYSIDLCRRVVASIGEQLGIEGIQIKWVPVTLQTRMDAVAKGQADMECGSTTVTLARMKQVDFSSYTFVDGTGLLVKADAGISKLTDLGGKKLGVLPGTTNEKALNDALKKSAINAVVVPVKSRDEGFAQFEAGELDAFIGDRVLLMGMSPKAKSPKSITMLADTLSMEPYAIVLPLGDDKLRLAVNTALARIYRSGAIVDVFGRWFGGMGKPGLMLEAMFVLGSIPE
ncbi:amino acid ABC transporter substrate-binding protein [Niveibacterium sp. 24ML]|uniref:amino acid ABC transporter substrate-binding protein n=1 Tax=Niveibacterium sp. 24ML TaxID=2985512 RepID=UPI0022709833|nr:amino acid ABC transporter substrate-binding protein [Niveibacterium sp. 24ML]MCX9154808.1 amino acid ABC transporter substrate-binding protein [Niveibacterium sp. 24ML]